MRLARFSLNDSPRYAFVQKDETDGKDYLIELDLRSGSALWPATQVKPPALVIIRTVVQRAASACFCPGDTLTRFNGLRQELIEAHAQSLIQRHEAGPFRNSR